MHVHEGTERHTRRQATIIAPNINLIDVQSRMLVKPDFFVKNASNAENDRLNANKSCCTDYTKKISITILLVIMFITMSAVCVVIITQQKQQGDYNFTVGLMLVVIPCLFGFFACSYLKDLLNLGLWTYTFFGKGNKTHRI